MKIVQHIPIGEYVEFASGVAYTSYNEQFYFEPQNYTGITQILFEASAALVNGTGTGYIRLYNITHDVEIAVISFTSSSQTRVESADIKALLTEACLLRIEYKVTTTTGTPGMVVHSPGILIFQDDKGIHNRTTETVFNLGAGYANYGTVWYYNNTDKVNPHIGNFDGEITCYLDTVFRINSLGTCLIRLFDLTENKAVSGSTIQTNSTTYQHARSGKITLIGDHIYVKQYKGTISGNWADILNASIIVIAKNYNMIASVCMGSRYGAEPYYAPPWNLSQIGKSHKNSISGDNGLDYVVDWNVDGEMEEAVTAHWGIRNITDGDYILGTSHSLLGPGLIEYYHNDVITLPNDGDLMVAYTPENYAWHASALNIVVLQQENMLNYQEQYADLSQPSGFHCFMKQYLRNTKLGYIPSLTPDGVNKCW